MWDEGLPTHGSTACVYIYKMPGHVDHGWHDGSCYRKMPFVCESAKGGTNRPVIVTIVCAVWLNRQRISVHTVQINQT